MKRVVEVPKESMCTSCNDMYFVYECTDCNAHILCRCKDCHDELTHKKIKNQNIHICGNEHGYPSSDIHRFPWY